jgi:hypothetical protein
VNKEKTVIVNGREFDAITGLPVKKSSRATAKKPAPAKSSDPRRLTVRSLKSQPQRPLALLSLPKNAA